MCYEPRNEEFAKVCRERDEQKAELQNVIAKLHETESERDELNAALEGAKLSMKALNEKLVQVTAERDELKKIIAGGIDACDYCKHEMEGMCGNTCECMECPAPCVCGKCYGGSMFEYRGVETDHG